MLEKRVAYDVVNVGDYVDYDTKDLLKTRIVAATETGFENSQYFRACRTGKWRVYRKNDGKIELVSAMSVGELWLQGIVGYEKLVKTLRYVAQSYINPKFAESARPLGATSRSIGEVYIRKGIKNTFPYRDKRGFAEVKSLKKKGLLPNLLTKVWLGSRDVVADDQGYVLMARTMSESGVVESETLFYSGLDMDIVAVKHVFGVIVFVTLKPGILIEGGDGSEAAPYKITI